MDIGKQKQLVIRIQADLRKEAGKHRRDGSDMAACDCDEQAVALECVIESLTTLAQVRSAVELMAGLLPANGGK
jgi:hypothetical protein